MSTAHRPTWTPAQGRETRGRTQQYSSRDMAAHTRLKFRKPGQGNTDDVARRDLRAELEQAEAEARSKKGLAPLAGANAAIKAIQNGDEGKKRSAGEALGGEDDDQERKRRAILTEAIELDRDDDDDSEEEGRKKTTDKGKGKEVEADGDSDNDDDDEEDSDDEDETAELLRELEKVRRERAEEKERLVRLPLSQTFPARCHLHVCVPGTRASGILGGRPRGPDSRRQPAS